MEIDSSPVEYKGGPIEEKLPLQDLKVALLLFFLPLPALRFGILLTSFFPSALSCTCFTEVCLPFSLFPSAAMLRRSALHRGTLPPSLRLSGCELRGHTHTATTTGTLSAAVIPLGRFPSNRSLKVTRTTDNWQKKRKSYQSLRCTYLCNQKPEVSAAHGME